MTETDHRDERPNAAAAAIVACLKRSPYEAAVARASVDAVMHAEFLSPRDGIVNPFAVFWLLNCRPGGPRPSNRPSQEDNPA